MKIENIQKFLEAINFPAAIAVENEWHFSSSLRNLLGVRGEISDKELVAQIQGDPSFVQVKIDQSQTLIVPMELKDVLAVYTASIKDQLTDSLNRRGLLAAYSRLRSIASPEGLLLVLYFDANKFKLVNDQYGHEVGDQILVAMCRRLRGQLKGNDLVARIGGDEFVALVWLPNEELGRKFIAERLPQIQRAVCKEPYALDDGSKVLPTSFALGVYQHRGELPKDYSELLRRAEVGMYADKGSAGR
jgi:diguanylate cyclase (GGDEF)-like protein